VFDELRVLRNRLLYSNVTAEGLPLYSYCRGARSSSGPLLRHARRFYLTAAGRLREPLRVEPRLSVFCSNTNRQLYAVLIDGHMKKILLFYGSTLQKDPPCTTVVSRLLVRLKFRILAATES
jgi:hypothetical protein